MSIAFPVSLPQETAVGGKWRLVWNPNWRLEKETSRIFWKICALKFSSRSFFEMCFNRSIQGCSVTSYSNYHLFANCYYACSVSDMIQYACWDMLSHIWGKKIRLFSISKWDFGTLRWLSSELTNLLPTSGDWFCQLLYWWISQRLSAAGLRRETSGDGFRRFFRDWKDP